MTYIAETAIIYGHEELFGKNVSIGEHAELDHGVEIGAGTRVESGAVIQRQSVIGSRVIIGSRTKIGPRALILDDALICPDYIESGSSDARRLGKEVSIGKGVLLHNEVELGDHTIVPTQRTIVSLGNFGRKNRVVTIHGSNEGPRYSIGCQISLGFEEIWGRVLGGCDTTQESAATYLPFLDTFQEIGGIVQRAYEDASSQVREIEDMRLELGLDRLPTRSIADVPATY